MNSTDSDTTAALSISSGGFGMGKAEKLRHKRLVDRLFAAGKSVYAYPLRAVWLVEPMADTIATFRSHHIPDEGSPSERLKMMRIDALQFLISVPKRKQHHAVDRVWLRRRIREAWRLQRSPLKQYLQQHELTMSVALIYVEDTKLEYADIAVRIGKIVTKLEKKAHIAAGDISDSGESITENA